MYTVNESVRIDEMIHRNAQDSDPGIDAIKYHCIIDNILIL